MASFKVFIQYDKAGWAMLTAAMGTAWSLRLGRPRESPAQGSLTRSRSSPSPGPCLALSETVSAPQSRHHHRSLPLRPRQCLKAETQNVPIRLASSLLHLGSFVAFHGARYQRACEATTWASAMPSAPTVITTTNRSKECP
jgi:hypothetical protein